MILDTSRFLSDRLIFNPTVENRLQAACGFWDWFLRVVSWIWAPSTYTDENRRTIEAFRHYLLETLGAEKLQRISNRYSLNLDQMIQDGSPLLSRDVAKIVIGTKNVTVQDINEKIQRNQHEPRFYGKVSFLELDGETLKAVQEELKSTFDRMWRVAEVADRITGRPTEFFARLFYDPLLADRERLQAMQSHSSNNTVDFIHNMVVRVIKREMDVGTLIPAPNLDDGRAQFYYVSGKLATGKGIVSYILHPAGTDSSLEAVRLFRGTSPRSSELDAISTVLTDLEGNMGYSAYISGRSLEPYLQERLGPIRVAAGHSLGSAILQHFLVETDQIQTAYLYCGPGISEEEVNRFNQRNPRMRLVIRLCDSDLWCQFGEMHLGYHAPENVEVDFVRYRPVGENDYDPHVTLWGTLSEHFEAEQVTPEVRDVIFDHKNFSYESCRVWIGPVVAFFLEWVRDFIRFFFETRIGEENGLKIGYMAENRWRVDHFQVV